MSWLKSIQSIFPWTLESLMVETEKIQPLSKSCNFINFHPVFNIQGLNQNAIFFQPLRGVRPHEILFPGKVKKPWMSFSMSKLIYKKWLPLKCISKLVVSDNTKHIEHWISCNITHEYFYFWLLVQTPSEKCMVLVSPKNP